MEQLALQLEEESRAIYKYKATVEGTRQSLENMRAEVDAKEQYCSSEKGKLDEAKRELLLRQQQIEGLRYQYLKDQNVAEASRKLQMSMQQVPMQLNKSFQNRASFGPEYAFRSEPDPKLIPQTTPRGTAFNASEFIKEINNEVLIK
jgi:AAA15 family ATPase/GTPase